MRTGKGAGAFQSHIDCGALGEQEVDVRYGAYRPYREAEDDLPSMELTYVFLECRGWNVLDILTNAAKEQLEVEAWENFDEQ